jgi:hypothetical protein
VPAGFALIVAEDGTQTTQNLFQLGDEGIFVPLPIDLTDETQQVFLLLFATGVRGRSDLSAVTAQAGGVAIPTVFAGPQGEFEAFDQVNLGPLSRELLSGRGRVDLAITVDGMAANIAELEFTGPLLTPIPFLSAIEPTSISAGEQTLVTLTGTNLSDVTGVEISPAEGVTIGMIASTAASSQRVGQTVSESVTVDIDVAADAAPGARTLTVMSANGRSNEVELTINEPAPTALTISNLELTAQVSGLFGLVLGAGFDFNAPDANIIFGGSIENSAHVEAILMAPTGSNRCTFLLAGSLLNDGTRSNTLQIDVDASPLCPAGSSAMTFTFP